MVAGPVRPSRLSVRLVLPTRTDKPELRQYADSTQAENNTQTARVVGRPFPKGVSGNPGGRPSSKGLIARIREETRDGEEIADFMLSVFRDKTASRRDRMEAASWLTDRAYGRAAQTLRREVEVPAGVSFAELTHEQRQALLARVAARRLELEAGEQR
jgi:hypothetical protein